jgi:peptide/nickel transport system permease protein
VTIRFLLRRLFWSIFLFVAATMVTYLIFYVVPRNPAALIPGGNGSSIAGQRIRYSLHLDVSVYQQYWIFVWNMIRHGSLGYSYLDGASVRTIIGRDAPVTASLVAGGAVFWLALSVPIGIVSALRPRSLLDRSGMVFVLIGISAPAVWIGLILAYTFGFRLGWTPIADYCDFFPDSLATCSGPAEWAYHLILPWTTFMLVFAAIYTRMIRASVLETLSEDFIRTARAKGAAGVRLLAHHVLRNSLLPIITMLGMDLGLSISNALFTETVFNLNGLGSDMVYAARIGNLPVVVGVVVTVTVVVIVLNFLVDIAYGFLDPRIRLRG